MLLSLHFLKQSKKIYFHGLRGYATEATLATNPYKLYKLDTPPPAETKLSKDEGFKMYRLMSNIREMETAAKAMYRRKEIRGFCHLYIGQEAVAVGFMTAIRPVDTLISSYRIHGWTYLTCGSLVACLSELTGRKSGISRGKGGSMHMYDKRCFGGAGIVGAQCPNGTGVAFAHKYLKTGGVNITMYGDGAANQGQLYESFNMAKLWSLPCLFLCENNHFAMGTSEARHASSNLFYTRADYIPGIWVDGMDVLSVREAAKFALEYCSSGKGPLVMEASTYRFTGHSMSDPDTTYRTRDEVKEKRDKEDPLKVFKNRMIKAELATDEDFKKIDEKAKKAVAEAVKTSLADKEIPLAELCYDIHINNIETDIRGISPWDVWKAAQTPISDLPCHGSPKFG